MKSFNLNKLLASVAFVLLGLTACTSNAPVVDPSEGPSTFSPTSAPTNQVSPSEIATECDSTEISYSWGETQGAAGTSYRILLIENVSDGQCLMSEAPEVLLYVGQEQQLVNQVQEQEGIDLGFPVSLLPGEVINLPIGTPNADNYDPEMCQSDTANWINIQLTGDSKLTVLKVIPWVSCTTLDAAPFFAPIGSQ